MVICDSYVDSSLAYQAYARGLGVEFITQINERALTNYCPDLTVFIDLSPEDAFKRKKGADADDRLEQAGMEFHRKVYAGYKELAEKYSERIFSVDGKQSPEEIFADVLKVLKKRNCI